MFAGKDNVKQLKKPQSSPFKLRITLCNWEGLQPNATRDGGEADRQAPKGEAEMHFLSSGS